MPAVAMSVRLGAPLCCQIMEKFFESQGQNVAAFSRRGVARVFARQKNGVVETVEDDESYFTISAEIM
jgi:hypothetical protein